jgi:hypothetical protein
MRRDPWISAFRDAVQRLRPHLTDKLAEAIALNLFDAVRDPAEVAREWHKRHAPTPKRRK